MPPKPLPTATRHPLVRDAIKRVLAKCPKKRGCKFCKKLKKETL